MAIFNFDDIVNEANKSRENKEAVRLSGNFNVEVGYASASTRKKDGSTKNPTIGIKLVVLDGPQVGDEAWWNVVLTDKSRAAFGRTLMGLGVPEEFLRSLGTASTEDEIAGKLQEIAETLVGARYAVTVGPNPKNPQFDSYVINSILEAPEVADTSSAPAVATAPVTTTTVPVPSIPTGPTVAPAGVPSVPGGFVPQLTNN